jgi:hypothetical protein
MKLSKQSPRERRNDSNQQINLHGTLLKPSKYRWLWFYVLKGDFGARGLILGGWSRNRPSFEQGTYVLGYEGAFLRCRRVARKLQDS